MILLMIFEMIDKKINIESNRSLNLSFLIDLNT